MVDDAAAGGGAEAPPPPPGAGPAPSENPAKRRKTAAAHLEALPADVKDTDAWREFMVAQAQVPDDVLTRAHPSEGGGAGEVAVEQGQEEEEEEEELGGKDNQAEDNEVAEDEADEYAERMIRVTQRALGQTSAAKRQGKGRKTADLVASSVLRLRACREADKEEEEAQAGEMGLDSAMPWDD